MLEKLPEMGLQKKAEEASAQEWKHQKQNYDKCLCCAKLEGDLVLIRQKAFKGKHKIVDQWENDPMRSLANSQDMPIYKVKLHNRNNKSITRILHQNMLFPLATRVPCESDSMDSNSPILQLMTDIDDLSDQVNQE